MFKSPLVHAIRFLLTFVVFLAHFLLVCFLSLPFVPFGRHAYVYCMGLYYFQRLL